MVFNFFKSVCAFCTTRYRTILIPHNDWRRISVSHTFWLADQVCFLGMRIPCAEVWELNFNKSAVFLMSQARGDWLLRDIRSVFFGVLQNLSYPMIRQARIGDTVLVKSREMTGRTRTMPWWLGREEVETTENKIRWPRWTMCKVTLKNLNI